MKRRTKTCPTCPGGPRELELAKFGVDRARSDGRNVRCKQCVAQRMAERRAAVKAGRLPSSRRRGRPRSDQFVPRRAGPAVMIDAPLVLTAIDLSGGICSQREIVKFAATQVRGRPPRHVLEDQIGTALGELFDERAIATRGEAEGRVYFRRGAFVWRSGG